MGLPTVAHRDPCVGDVAGESRRDPDRAVAVHQCLADARGPLSRRARPAARSDADRNCGSAPGPGAGVLTGGNSKQAALGLGLVLIAYAALGLSKIEFSIPRRFEIWVGPLVGVATGMIMAATGIFVIPGLALHAGDRAGEGRTGAGARPAFHDLDGRARGRAVERQRLRHAARDALADRYRAGVDRHGDRTKGAAACERRDLPRLPVPAAAHSWRCNSWREICFDGKTKSR